MPKKSQSMQVTLPPKLSKILEDWGEEAFQESVLGADLAAKCVEAFREGVEKNRLIGNETENSPGASGSSGRASPKQTSKKLAPVTKLGGDSPLVRAATLEETKAVVADLGFTFGHTLSKDRVEAIAEAVLLDAGDRPQWTYSEMQRAKSLIAKDKDLAKEVSYARTIAPGVFASAKERFDVKRGRPLRYREARRLAEEEETELGEMFEHVQIEGIKTQSGNPIPFWRIRSDYDRNAEVRTFRPEG